MMQANKMRKETLSASNTGIVVDIQGLEVKMMPLKNDSNRKNWCDG